MNLTSPEWSQYIAEIKKKKCSACNNNIGSNDWPNCKINKSWPRHGICHFMEDYMPEKKLDDDTKRLIKLLWLEKKKMEIELEQLTADAVGSKMQLSTSYVRQLWREFENGDKNIEKT